MINSDIRFATIADLPTIIEIYNATIPSRMVTADLEPVTLESRKEWFAGHSRDTYPLWVLVEEDKVLAWVGLQPFHKRVAYKISVEVSIYVSPTAKGKGIGKRLLNFAEHKAIALGYLNVVGLIFSQNTPSVNLFQKFGYSEWGNLPNVAVLDGVECGLKIFGKRLA